MTRSNFVWTALLGLAGVMTPAPVAAQAGTVGVTGAGEAAFPDGVTFNGVSLLGLELGQSLFIAADGSATGQFHAVLRGTSVLGLAQDITVQGKVSGGTAGSGSVSFGGTATVDLGDGTVPLLDVPFTATASTGSLQLVLDAASLPAVTLTAGSITIK
jgi:hypothetical protein